VFDGGSFAMDGNGVLTAQGGRFDESLLMLEMGRICVPSAKWLRH